MRTLYTVVLLYNVQIVVRANSEFFYYILVGVILKVRGSYFVITIFNPFFTGQPP